MFGITRHVIRNKQLRPWVNFLWCFHLDDGKVSHQLLPTDTIDLLINLSAPMIYETNAMEVEAPPVHLNGLRRQYSTIHHKGRISVYGISFSAYGLFPFVKEKRTKIQEQIVNFYEVAPDLADQLKRVVQDNAKTEVFAQMEAILCGALEVSEELLVKASLIEEFLAFDDFSQVKEFCSAHDLQIKTFERMVFNYTGYLPKVLHRLRRFQRASNQLVHQKEGQLADIAYDHGFADQSHFIKEFQRFSGLPPRSFLEKKRSVKENAVYDFL